MSAPAHKRAAVGDSTAIPPHAFHASHPAAAAHAHAHVDPGLESPPAAADGQTWLVCVDGSVGADRALAWAIRSMHTHRDKLVVLTVTELVESSQLSQLEEFIHAQIKFNAELEKHSQRLLDTCAATARAAKVRHVDTVVLRGDAKYEIETWVRGSSVDNVVVSRRGTGDTEADGVGGVSDYLVQRLPTNVIVVK